MNRRLLLFVPLAAFAFFLGLAGYQLSQPRDEAVPSRMVGKALPTFELPPATGQGEGLSDAYFRDGRPKLLNIWASWCVPCIAEAPQLEALQEAGATIAGVAIRDTPEDVRAFLARHGDPYARIGADQRSSVQLAIGSSGVPETFVIDGSGTIRYQHIGDIRERDVPTLLAELEKAGR